MTAGRRLRVTVWNEYVHERGEESVKRIYPDGMHRPIADGIRRELGDGVSVRIATLEEPEHGLTEEALAETDVLTWWGHAAHDEVTIQLAVAALQVRSEMSSSAGVGSELVYGYQDELGPLAAKATAPWKLQVPVSAFSPTNRSPDRGRPTATDRGHARRDVRRVLRHPDS